MITNCLICNEPNSTIELTIPPSGRSISCKSCGNYQINDGVFGQLQSTQFKEKLSESKRANMRGWIRENQNAESALVINEHCLERLLTLKTITISEKAHKFLQWLNKKTEYFGHLIDIMCHFDELIATCYATNQSELCNILTYLTDTGYIDGGPNHKRLTFNGLSYLEEYAKNTDSDIGFCAMCFDSSLNMLWDKAIEPAISNAGYIAKRVDKGDHIDGVVDEILASIRRSKFVIVDLTKHRNGVYLEAGFAKGLGIKVIFTCKEEELNESHFDVRHLNILVWNEHNLKDFKLKLQNRIEVNLGRGRYAV